MFPFYEKYIFGSVENFVVRISGVSQYGILKPGPRIRYSPSIKHFPNFTCPYGLFQYSNIFVKQ